MAESEAEGSQTYSCSPNLQVNKQEQARQGNKADHGTAQRDSVREPGTHSRSKATPRETRAPPLLGRAAPEPHRHPAPGTRWEVQADEGQVPDWSRMVLLLGL